jgi:thymidylate synthase (FAD)
MHPSFIGKIDFDERRRHMGDADTPEASWVDAMLLSEQYYKTLLKMGWRPEEARSVLPNSLKTEIIMTCNVREWRHVFNLRTSKAAHPQIRELMLDCLAGFKKEIPVIFDDIGD